MKYAVINDVTNIVENTVVLDEGSTWTPPIGYYIESLEGTEAGIGWSYDKATGQFIAPPEPESETEAIDGEAPSVIG